MLLTGCATRPSSEILEPANIGKIDTQKITLLAVTNRNRDSTGKGFDATWAGSLNYEQYEVSAPSNRNGTIVKYPTSKPDPQRQFVVIGRKQLSKNAFVETAVNSAQFDGTVVVFVHGYNYSYQEALFRMAQIAADAKAPTIPILYSWPSAAAVTGYVADRDAVLYSRSELDALVQSLSTSRKVKRIVLFGHSMGGFLVMEAVRQFKLQGRDDVINKLAVVLAAPDIDADVFRSQLLDIGQLNTPITLFVSKVDRALTASSLLGGERPRVGRLDVDDPFIKEVALKARLRVIDITAIQGSDGLGHDRYASLAKFGAKLSNDERNRRLSARDVGAFVFDTTGAIVASPFHLAGNVIHSP